MNRHLRVASDARTITLEERGVEIDHGGGASAIAGPDRMAMRTMFSGFIRLGDVFLLVIFALAARLLGAEGFGVFMTSMGIAMLLISPLVESFGPGMTRSAARDSRAALWNLGAIIPLQLAMMLCLALAVWATLRLTATGQIRTNVIAIMILAVGMRGPLEVMRAALRGIGRFDLELASVWIERALLLASVASIWIVGRQPLALASSFAVTRVVTALLTLPSLRCLGDRVRWHVTNWRRHLKEAFPFSLTKAVNTAWDQTGILCLGWLLTTTAAGLYAGAYRLIEGVCAIPQTLVLVLLPELAVRQQQAPLKVAPLVRRTASYVSLMALPLAAGFLVEGKWVIQQILGTGYEGAAAAFRVLSVGLPLVFSAEIARTTLWALNDEQRVLRIGSQGLVINIGLSVLLIPRYGVVGAAVAVVAGWAAVCTALWYRLSRHWSIDWPWHAAVVKPGAAALAVAAVLACLQWTAWPIRLLIALAVGVLTLVGTRAITASEWSLLGSLPMRLAQWTPK